VEALQLAGVLEVADHHALDGDPLVHQRTFGAGALHLSADGRFLGVLNRGDDTQLVTFAVDPASGQLRFVERR
ncbi:beta-propeller fold lactonase family protein, partial [Klebsiella pneumoniae]